MQEEEMPQGYDFPFRDEAAEEAYSRGYHPISHWTKKMISAFILRRYPENAEKLNKLPLWYLQERFLKHACWERTGPYHVRTEFSRFEGRYNQKSLDSIIEEYPEWRNEKLKAERIAPFLNNQKTCSIITPDNKVMHNMLIVSDNAGNPIAYSKEELVGLMEKYNEETEHIAEIYPELYHLLMEDISKDYNIWDPTRYPYYSNRHGFFLPKSLPVPKSGKVKAINEAIPVGTIVFYASSNWSCSYREWTGRSWVKTEEISNDIIRKIQNAGTYEFSPLRFCDKATPIRDFDIYKPKKET